ncbi:craniofacial development protein 2 [Chelydra serpentina]|uniref:Craniofacial development protein 2 n=1 Tax=Chelydra serpentina TaxID=8475 RepID=A0A8T1T001_CHESE|nr:craniofacial development protein 2 [Chelydra serpentina]
MVLHINLSGDQYATITSAYTQTMTHTDEIKELFYEDLRRIIRGVPHQDKLIVLGDCNAHVGANSDPWSRVLSHHNIGRSNSNSQLLLSKCAKFNLTVINTVFQQVKNYKTTWMHPRSKH